VWGEALGFWCREGGKGGRECASSLSSFCLGIIYWFWQPVYDKREKGKEGWESFLEGSVGMMGKKRRREGGKEGTREHGSRGG